jgi:hypothetical protein
VKDWQIFGIGCAIVIPLLCAWVKIRLWEWQADRERR